MSGQSARISAATTVVGVMGDPISHSLSPLIHNSAFRSLGLDWVCVGFPTTQGHAPEAVRGIAALGMAGMSVTMPHKQAVIDSLDLLSDDARSLGAVNCIHVDRGRLVGHNTDGTGFVAAMHHDFGVGPEGKDCVVIGAGGAARSVVLALGRSGASSVTVVNRSRVRAEVAAALTPVGRIGTSADIPGCDVVINATPLGMEATTPGTTADGADPISVGDRGDLPCDPSMIREGHIVVDLVYEPLWTRWLRAAADRGARTSNGTSMLVHQAAVAFELWTGMSAPVTVMAEAVEDAVRARSG